MTLVRNGKLHYLPGTLQFRFQCGKNMCSKEGRRGRVVHSAAWEKKGGKVRGRCHVSGWPRHTSNHEVQYTRKVEVTAHDAKKVKMRGTKKRHWNAKRNRRRRKTMAAARSNNKQKYRISKADVAFQKGTGASTQKKIAVQANDRGKRKSHTREAECVRYKIRYRLDRSHGKVIDHGARITEGLKRVPWLVCDWLCGGQGKCTPSGCPGHRATCCDGFHARHRRRRRRRRQYAFCRPC